MVRLSRTLLSSCHNWREFQGKSVPWSEAKCMTCLQLLHTLEPPAEGKAGGRGRNSPRTDGPLWDSRCLLLWFRWGYLCHLQQFKASFFPPLQSLACLFPTHVFYLVLATFEDWYWMALGSDPTNWQSWPQGMNKTLTGINITLIMVQWALFCVLLDSPEQFLWINDWAAAGSGLPPGLPGALFSIHMGTTVHTGFKAEFCYAQHI